MLGFRKESHCLIKPMLLQRRAERYNSTIKLLCLNKPPVPGALALEENSWDTKAESGGQGSVSQRLGSQRIRKSKRSGPKIN